MNDIYLYLVEIKWYDAYEDKETVNRFYAFANSIKDLGERIDSTFSYIKKIKIQEVDWKEDDNQFLYVDNLSKEVLNLINEGNKF